MAYHTVSQQSQQRQEDWPVPWLCLSSKSLPESKLAKLGITVDQYVEEGRWITKLPNYSHLTEHEVHQLVSKKRSDILTKLTVKRRIERNRDAPIKESYTPDEIINSSRISLMHLDYDKNFGIFCFDFLVTAFPFGIEKLYFYTKSKLKVYTVAPGNLYTFERKRNSFTIEDGFKFNFQVRFKIKKPSKGSL